MSIFLQIGLGLIPAAAGLIALLIKRKIFSFKSIFPVLLTIVFITTMLLNSNADVVSANATEMSREDVLALAYCLVDEEAWQSTDEIIDEYASSFGYDEECTLLVARIKAIQGDSFAAASLYRKLIQLDSSYENSLSKEIAAVDAACSSMVADEVMLNYIYSTGKTPADYNLSDNLNKDVLNDMVNIIKDAVSEECDNKNASKEIEELATVMKKSEDLYADYIATSSSTLTPSYSTTTDDYNARAEELIEEFEEIADDYPEALSVYPVRMARLKNFVLAEDYAAIAQAMDKYTSYDELMIASELLMNGYITEDDFDNFIASIDEDEIEELCNQLTKNINNSGLSQEEIDSRMERIAGIRKSADDDVLEVLQNRLTAMINSKAVNVDKSKIYLQNSKIDRYQGDEESANDNMILAIDTAPNSTDDNYSYPMCELSGIIKGTSDAENVKNITAYVDMVVDNSLTVRPVSDIFTEKSDPATDSSDDSEKKSFADYMEEQISFYGAAVNIGMIDYSKFPDISAKVQLSDKFVDPDKDAKPYISVLDCEQNIEDFTIEKINYSESNIMLLCDNSGSMSGNVEQLKTAVRTFVDSSNSDEKISLVTFDNSVLKETSFSNSRNQLDSVIDGMGAYGGTNIYRSALAQITRFPSTATANNIMIIMTDGQDGYRAGIEEMQNNLKVEAEKRGVTIYTLGLGGSVDAEYLTNIAITGGGDFVYASEAGKLESLYSLIHGQSRNQYLLKYTAKDTLTLSSRPLTVALKDDSSLCDTKSYSLNDDIEDKGVLTIMENIIVYGLDTRIIYKGDKDTTVKFSGEGFGSTDELILTLDGMNDYVLHTEYIDEGTYSVQIPYGIPVDTYDLRVSINKNSTILPNELYVVDDNRKSVTYGGYTFTANTIVTESSSKTLLSGMVTMNDWLQFNGDVTLEGDIKNGYSIRLLTTDSASVSFDASARGYAKYLADKGRSLTIPSLNGITLYNDTEHITDFTNYKVQALSNAVFKTMNLNLVDAGISLYPNRVEFQGGTMSSTLPFQNTIIKAVSGKDPFTAKIDSATIVNQSGIMGEANVSYKDSGYFTGAKLGSCNIQFKEGTFNWNSLENTIGFKFLIKLDYVKDEKDTTLGVSVGWKDGLLDEIVFYCDRDLTLNVSGVPVTISDFSGGLTDLVNTEGSISKTDLLNSNFNIGTKISVAKFSTYFNALKPYFGNLSLLSTDDFNLKFSLGQGSFSASTDLLFLEEVKLAEAELKLGNMSYTNTMLGLENESATGLYARVKSGFIYDKLDKLKIDISGEGELSLNSRFCGVQYKGTAALTLKWWFVDAVIDKSGEVMVGIRTTHDDKQQFVIGHRFIDNNKIDHKVYTIGGDGIQQVL